MTVGLVQNKGTLSAEDVDFVSKVVGEIASDVYRLKITKDNKVVFELQGTDCVIPFEGQKNFEVRAKALFSCVDASVQKLSFEQAVTVLKNGGKVKMLEGEMVFQFIFGENFIVPVLVAKKHEMLIPYVFSGFDFFTNWVEVK